MRPKAGEDFWYQLKLTGNSSLFSTTRGVFPELCSHAAFDNASLTKRDLL